VTPAPKLNLEPLARAVESDLYRVQADAERVGDLGVRQAFVFAQHEDRSIGCWKRIDVLIEAIAHFLLKHAVLRVW
jgi:hypothetical protein